MGVGAENVPKRAISFSIDRKKAESAVLALVNAYPDDFAGQDMEKRPEDSRAPPRENGGEALCCLTDTSAPPDITPQAEIFCTLSKTIPGGQAAANKNMVFYSQRLRRHQSAEI
jgi:hypothetical protein